MISRNLRQLAKRSMGNTIQQVPFDWQDPLQIDQMVNEDELMMRDAFRQYCQEKLQTRVTMSARHETFDRNIMNEMGEMGVLGPTIEGYRRVIK